METEVKLTKLANCAGCGAKMGAGTLARMLEGFKAHSDPRLIVGYDKSDDASVYVLDDNTALIQTTDFFPPIVDDPYLYGKIAATNALSDVYAMGGEPKLALNILCAAEGMADETIREILRGGYDAAFDAGAIIAVFGLLIGILIGVVVASIRSSFDKNREALEKRGGFGYYLLKLLVLALAALGITIARKVDKIPLVVDDKMIYEQGLSWSGRSHRKFLAPCEHIDKA